LATAAIVNKRRRNMLKELIKVIQQERYTYSDPVTEFLECLYVNYDFEGAQQKLRECEEVRPAIGFFNAVFNYNAFEWGDTISWIILMFAFRSLC